MSQALKSCVLIIVLGFLYSAYDFYSFSSETLPKMRGQRDQMQAELNRKLGELNRLRQFVANIDAVKQELRDLNLKFENALESMPRTFNLSGLLRKLNLLAQNSGVELSNFKPRPRGMNEDEKAQKNRFFETMAITCTVRGSFTQTLVFFDQISRLRRIVNLESLKLKVNDKSREGKTSLMMAETEAVLQAYRFTD